MFRLRYVLFLVAPVTVGKYSFRDLGLPSALGKAGLSALSANGSVFVGGIEDKPVAVLTSDLSYSILALGPYHGAFPLGVSADGRTAVGQIFDNPNNTPENAAVWRDGRLRVLGLEPGGYRAEADAISADGRVVVGYANSTTHGLQAARWVNGQIQNLGDISGGGLGSQARAVSADGSVVVGTGMAFTRAFRWESGTMEALPLTSPLNTVDDADAFDVSSDGSRVVGTIHHDPPDAFGYYEAILWEQGSPLVLGNLPGQRTAQATAISDDGDFVFGYSGTGGINSAFVWDELNGMRKLSDILEANGVDLQRWQRLSEIRDVSADGHTILGYGYNERGFYSPFMATIPEPGTLSLVAISFVILGGRSSRGRCATRRSEE